MFDVYNFGSGSSGNSTLVSDGETTILIDIGLSLSRIKNGIKNAGYNVEDIKAILITHLHTDHAKPVGLNHFERSLMYGCFVHKEYPNTNYIEPLVPFQVGTLRIIPLLASHDDWDVDSTIGFRIENKLGEVLVYLTDTGYVPEENIELIANANIYMFESNHDLETLRFYSSYPHQTIERIDSEVGHLSNYDSAIALFYSSGPNTKQIVLLHLSIENNTPQLALQEFTRIFRNDSRKSEIKIDVARPEEVTHFKW